jgi:hypothetical protein
MEEKFHSKKISHSHRVSTKIQCIRPEFRSVLLSFFLCGISFPYIYFYETWSWKIKQIFWRFLSMNGNKNACDLRNNFVFYWTVLISIYKWILSLCLDSWWEQHLEKKLGKLIKWIWSLKTKFKLTILMRFPMASPGKFFLNRARTLPLLPCNLVTFPQIARTLDLCLEFVGEDFFDLALYTKTQRLPT